MKAPEIQGILTARQSHPHFARRLRHIGVLAAFFVALLAVSAAFGAEPDELIQSLDLSRPELARVKENVDRRDLNAARRAFADYLRKRTSVHWQFDPAAPPKTLSAAE